MTLADSIPGLDQIEVILKQDGAPPYVILDIGGSADLDGDGAVRVRLDDEGNVIVEDA